ncbi:heat shock transcription factor A7A [Artemisia annua]|uniref:Heat shock transcription factor A7A n=1 Tax=Artemisia annua TaxID=35608 RepID=A0A2U1NL33_ARTAN|nr:heat shock transcription factor A7A [Artemisia annua]
MEGLHDAGPPPFLTKVYDMVEDKSIDDIICWSRGGQSFVVLDPQAFSTNLLPRYFKHNNFSSFVRQLNTYKTLKLRSFHLKSTTLIYLVLQVITFLKSQDKAKPYLSSKNHQDLNSKKPWIPSNFNGSRS